MQLPAQPAAGVKLIPPVLPLTVGHPSELFRISLYRNGLILTRLNEDTDIAALLAELDGNETEGADWVSDNGELILAGDWLTLSGLLGQPLMIDVLPGKITIRAELGNMLA
ncbi:SymE family type I addiction module toxin [Lonsdalea quercina]|uniref:SymE family type I addiction module toxin n=1 Tax=Lonsdalea quercina TaxID=71657 RepID=UPI0039760553